MTRRSLLWIVAAGFLTSVLAGCAADLTRNPAGDGNSEGSNSQNSDKRLQCVSPCDSKNSPAVSAVKPEGSSVIRMRYVNGQGNPIPGVRVSFQVGGQSPDAVQLGTRNAQTSADGQVSLQLSSPGQTGAAMVTANANGAKMKFPVSVRSNNQAEFRIEASHSGDQAISPVEARLYKRSEVDCERLDQHLGSLRAGNGPDLPSPIQTTTVEVITGGTVPKVIFTALDPGQTLTVIAVGKGRSNSEVHRAYGCNDELPETQKGEVSTAKMEIRDTAPSIRGTYQVTHTFRFKSGLPDRARNIVELIGTLATDPAGFVLGTSDTKGLLELLANFLPDDSFVGDKIDSLLSKDIIKNALGSVLSNGAKSWVDANAAGWVERSRNVTASIYEVLESFTVKGEIQINQTQLGENGAVLIPEGGATQTWNQYSIAEPGSCNEEGSDCSRRQVSGSSLGSVEGTFTGTIKNGKLAIDKHPMTLNYGALMLLAVEKVVLPSIFGSSCGNGDEKCNSVGRVLQKMVDCGAVASKLPGGGFADRLIDVEGACNDVLESAGDKLKNYVVEKLNLETDNALKLQTPDEEGCELYQPSSYGAGAWTTRPLPYVQQLGDTEADSTRCNWTADLSLAGVETDIDGHFTGDRQ